MRMRKEVFILSIDDILPNRFQPRIKFNEEAILELSESIKKHGIIQPIIVRKISDKYEIIAGERRYKASVLAGKTTIPAIVTDVDDKESAEIALIENVQRQDMTPIEEAISYKKILDMGYLNQSDLANKLGKTQSTVANKLRLLNLNDNVQEALLEEKISERHARSLLKMDKHQQDDVLNTIINERLTVRKTDQLINDVLNKDKIQEPQIEVLDFGIEKGKEQMNNNFNIPSEPIIDESTNAQTINPGFMDIEKIENEAQDINFNISQDEINKVQFNPFGETVNMSSQENIYNPVTPIPTEEINESIVPPTPIEENIFSNNLNIQNAYADDTSSTEEGGRFFGMFNQPTSDNSNNLENTPSIFGQTPTPVVEPVQTTNMFGQAPTPVVEPIQTTNMFGQAPTPVVEPIQTINMFGQAPTPVVEPVQSTNMFGQAPTPVVEPVQSTNMFGQAPTPVVEPVISSVNQAEQIINPIDTFSLNDEQEFSNYNNFSNINVDQFNYNNLPEEKELTPVMNFNIQEPIQKADLRTVISTIRNCTSTIEGYGYIVDCEELDLENSYQVTIKINK